MQKQFWVTSFLTWGWGGDQIAALLQAWAMMINWAHSFSFAGFVMALMKLWAIFFLFPWIVTDRVWVKSCDESWALSFFYISLYVSLQFLFGFCNWAAVRYTLTPSWAPCCLLSSCCFQVSCLFYWFASSWVVCSSGLLPGDLSVLQACFQGSCLFFRPASCLFFLLCDTVGWIGINIEPWFFFLLQEFVFPVYVVEFVYEFSVVEFNLVEFLWPVFSVGDFVTCFLTFTEKLFC